MTKVYVVFAQALFMFCVLNPCNETKAADKMLSGKEAFERHCYVCHPKGGNVITSAKTLHSVDLQKNGIFSAADIVNKMRNPGPEMTKFDEQTIPDVTARVIAEYVLGTFK